MNSAQTLRQVIDRRAEEHSFGSLLVASDGDSVVSFGDVRRRCRVLAGELGERGLAAGDRVGILLENGLLAAELFLGRLHGGFVPTPMSPAASDSEIRWILEHSGARLCFAPVDEARRIRRAAPGEAPAVVAAEPERALGWEKSRGALAEFGPTLPRCSTTPRAAPGAPRACWSLTAPSSPER